MKVVLLAAGIGSRLRPITDTVPKCLVPINGKPLLDFWLDMVVPRQDVSEVFINVSYLKEQVISHIQHHWSGTSKIKIWHETELLGTAGTLVRNAPALAGEQLMVVHADNLSKFNLNEFIQAHLKKPKNCHMTMMLFETDSPSSCGIIELDKAGLVIKMYEKVTNPPGNLANGAVYIFEPSMLDWMKENQVIDISQDVIPAFQGHINSWLNQMYHRDIGTPESYAVAQQEFTKHNK